MVERLYGTRRCTSASRRNFSDMDAPSRAHAQTVVWVEMKKPRVSRASGQIGFWAQKKPHKAAMVLFFFGHTPSYSLPPGHSHLCAICALRKLAIGKPLMDLAGTLLT